jgi:hypothetical protein
VTSDGWASLIRATESLTGLAASRLGEWAERNGSVHADVLRQRLAREQEIRLLHLSPHHATQRGLFDRRSDRLAEDISERERIWADRSVARALRIGRGMRLVDPSVRVALVVLP